VVVVGGLVVVLVGVVFSLVLNFFFMNEVSKGKL
jgi:hypothetical protein